ncbi:unnamed protein product [Prunus armeniaca]
MLLEGRVMKKKEEFRASRIWQNDNAIRVAEERSIPSDSLTCLQPHAHSVREYMTVRLNSWILYTSKRSQPFL